MAEQPASPAPASLLQRALRRLRAPGVAARLAIAQGFIALLAVAIAVSGSRMFDELADEFARFATTQLPAQSMAGELSQLAQAVVADARALALTRQRFAKDGVLFKVEGSLARMRDLRAEIARSGIAADRMPNLDKALGELGESLRQLAAEAERNINGGEGIGRVVLALSVLQQDLVATDIALLRRFSASTADAIPALLDWQARSREGLRLINLALATPNPSELTRARGQFAALLPEIKTAAERVPKAASTEIGGLLDRLLGVAEGPAGAFETRARQLQLDASVASALARATALGGVVMAEARSVSAAVQVTVNTGAFALGKRIDNRTKVLFGLALFAIVCAAASGLYLRGRIVSRLRQLQAGMRRYVERGEPVAIVPGDDELTEVSASLSHLVAVIAEREQALRAAKAEAEAGVVALEAAQESLVQARKVAALGNLVAGVAHELNTPVGVLLGATTKFQGEAMRVRDEVAARRLTRQGMDQFLEFSTESLELIRRNVERIAAHVRNFKELAAGPEGEPAKSCYLVDVVRRALSGIDAQITQAGHRLTVDVPADLRLETVEDALIKTIQAVVDNCLRHAFRPGTRGLVLLRARAAGDSHIELTVSDDGCGVPADLLPRVFDPFVTTARASGRVGFGLHRTYTLVHGLLGGEVQLRSTEGEGTRVVIRLPLQLSRDSDADLAAAGVDPRLLQDR